MKYIYICSSFLFLLGCSVAKKSFEILPAPVKFVFENYSISENQNNSSMSKQIASIDSLYDPKGIDSLMNKSLKEVAFSNLWSETAPTKIFIEVTKDSIWRHRTQNGIMVGDYSMMLKNNSGVIHYYDKLKKFNYLNVDLFQNEKESEITITLKKDDRKIIKGYDCFKLVLVQSRTDADDFPGSTIYEMYVTDKIQLPAYAIEFNIPALPDLFPLEITVKESFLFGPGEGYRLIEIE